MTSTLSTAAYLGAAILFILSLGGLSNPETSRRGNLFGMVGMAIAVLATVLGPQVAPKGIAWIVAAMAVGGTIGLYAARVVKMTQMPELVALMHSLVGLAAMLVGFANFIDPAATAHFKGAERTIHQAEIYIGVLIGAVTFSGSVIAFGKLSAKISGKPVLLPGRHWINLAGLVAVIWLCARFVGARLINTEVRAGVPRMEAFQNFAQRTQVEDVQVLVTMLVQTDRFGTSVARSLRVHSDTLRSKRKQRAEEAAAKTGVKMVFPLVFCIFPAVWVVTIGPAAIKFVEVLFPLANK
jgi:hypothetical protein